LRVASDSVTILDNDWPGRALALMPGDLSRWMPQGCMAPRREDPQPEPYLGEVPGTGPIREAHSSVPHGGVLFFDDPREWAKLRGALELMGVYLKSKTYAVFRGATLDPAEDRYLHQVRIATHAALARYFKANAEAEALPEQPIPIGAYIETFIAEQQGKWNDGRQFSRVLEGILGGDGDSAREVLGFGFAVESAYLGVSPVEPAMALQQMTHGAP
jgi:hypothetical protein